MFVVPDPVLIVFKILLHLTFKITVNFSYYHLYFTDGKTEIQKDEAACPRHTAGKLQIWNSNLGHVHQESVLLTAVLSFQCLLNMKT